MAEINHSEKATYESPQAMRLDAQRGGIGSEVVCTAPGSTDAVCTSSGASATESCYQSGTTAGNPFAGGECFQSGTSASTACSTWGTSPTAECTAGSGQP